jgi:hypothetical protein
MPVHLKTVSLTTFMLLFCSLSIAQIPVEVFGANKKMTLDIMFFKYFKTKEGKPAKWLFFNRNRAAIDYKMTSTSYLPQFGFTEAISYNDHALRGLAPVLVVQILNKGIYPKAGIQFSAIKKDYTFFSWLVCEAMADPNIDFFFLSRYTPKLTSKVNLFTQLELVSAFPSVNKNNFNFIQRIRLGLKCKAFQFGAGIDLAENGRKAFINTTNTGVFLRYEF